MPLLPLHCSCRVRPLILDLFVVGVTYHLLVPPICVNMGQATNLWCTWAPQSVERTCCHREDVSKYIQTSHISARQLRFKWIVCTVCGPHLHFLIDFQPLWVFCMEEQRGWAAGAIARVKALPLRRRSPLAPQKLLSISGNMHFWLKGFRFSNTQLLFWHQ